jgi:hypothetical protein
VTHEGNDVVIEFRDDGAGLDFDASAPTPSKPACSTRTRKPTTSA